jgi:hypothetical protein
MLITNLINSHWEHNSNKFISFFLPKKIIWLENEPLLLWLMVEAGQLVPLLSDRRKVQDHMPP